MPNFSVMVALSALVVLAGLGVSATQGSNALESPTLTGEQTVVPAVPAHDMDGTQAVAFGYRLAQVASAARTYALENPAEIGDVSMGSLGLPSSFRNAEGFAIYTDAGKVFVWAGSAPRARQRTSAKVITELLGRGAGGLVTDSALIRATDGVETTIPAGMGGYDIGDVVAVLD